MPVIIPRFLEEQVRSALGQVPAVAILGPRQCGKTTLARYLVGNSPDVLYLDLERPSDISRLADPEALFAANVDRLICIDEIQREPELFPVMRYAIDADRRPGRFLILGSASKELIQQSSETLAGRIRYLELTPFLISEVADEGDLETCWLRGGFPLSCMAAGENASFEWRIDFIRDFLERDIPMLQPRIPPERIRRFWTMLAHNHGQLLNMAALAGSLGVQGPTVRSYIDLLEGAFMVRRLAPYAANLKKRLVKSPKLYIRDSGVLHSLLNISDRNTLFGHPVYGTSWEGFCLENILARCRRTVQAGFFRTVRGAEIDLILEQGSSRLAVEFKSSVSAKPQRGFWAALKDLKINRAWIIAPVQEGYPLHGAFVAALPEFIEAPENRDFFL
ncbi:ATP-binding protein [Thermodesulfobacteriota bacterium]